MLWIVFLLCICSAEKLTVYNNAQFLPNDMHFLVETKNSINSICDCASYCYNHSICLTAVYSGINKQCTLFSEKLNQGQLQLKVISLMMSVLSFKNKTLPNPMEFTSVNETVYSIWKTIAGGNSSASSVGDSSGNYPSGSGPKNLFDNDVYTDYEAYGQCTSSILSSGFDCGEKTGIYFSPLQGPTLLVAFQFYASVRFSLITNPQTLTIEGSNASPATLTLGSSWTLIYSGVTGLDSLVSLGQYGSMRSISTNSTWYSSYRFIITSKAGVRNSVSYSELKLYGYIYNKTII